MDIASLTSTVAHVSAGWLTLIAIGVLAFADSLRGGTSRTAALALSFPVSYMLLQFVGGALFMSEVQKQFTSSLAQALFAALAFGLVFVLIYRLTDSYGEDPNFVRSLAAATGLVIMAAIFWQLIPAWSGLFPVGEQIAYIFSGSYTFWWFSSALVALAFAKE